MVMSEAKKDADHRRKMMDAMMAKMKDNLGGVNVGFGKAKVGVNWADNSLTCDSEGNCMLKDKLTGSNPRTWSPQSRLAKDNGFSLNGSFGGVSGGIKFADNSLTCDSEGNCMLKDDLAKKLSIKEQIAADFAKETGGKTIAEAVADEI